MLRCAHGMCSIVGIKMGSKYSELKTPFSDSSQAKHCSCSLMNSYANFRSSGHKKPVGSISSESYLSCVNRFPGLNSGGFTGSFGRSFKGFGCGLRTILNSSGNVVGTGRTFLSTFL